MSQEQTPNDTPPADAAGLEPGAVDTAAAAATRADDAQASGSIIGDAVAGDAGGDDAADAAAASADGDGADGEAAADTVADAADAAAEEVTPYEGLTAPEGTTLSEENIAAATPLMRTFNVPDDQAQAFLDQAAPIIGGIVNEALEAAVASQLENKATVTREWAEEIQNDPEIGGPKLEQSRALMATALDKFFPPEFRTFLNETGLGNNPELARGLTRIGAQVSEGSIHRGEGGQQNRPTSAKLYGEAFQPKA